ncbi:hypothetical protein DPMN_077451 [Dreissena polymorpha]|uniref:Uncharacterized protein n=1 Tax=Dreissena polymorpha TaxID=45954 RepID=A0A9D3YKH9_DREPO|nr:hypothetical protein DPMN_077451 [Dreissena polymorpha]
MSYYIRTFLERLLFLLRTHFETYMPSDCQDELVKAVKNREVDNVYAIIRQAYQDFNVTHI